MSEPSTGATPKVQDVIKGVTELLASLTAVAKAAMGTGAEKAGDGTEKPDATESTGVGQTPPEPVDHLSEMLRHARAKYDTATRWTVGAFAAIGVLIFGSIPFANIGGVALWVPWSPGIGWIAVVLLSIGAVLALAAPFRVPLKREDQVRLVVATALIIGTPIAVALVAGVADSPILQRPTQLLAGLLLAAGGIAAVIWGTTRALEPEDASLGELALTLEGLDNEARYWLRPVRQANRDLRSVLSSSDASAHLGPEVEGYPAKRRSETDTSAAKRPSGAHKHSATCKCPTRYSPGVHGTIEILAEIQKELLPLETAHASVEAKRVVLVSDQKAIDESLTILRKQQSDLQASSQPRRPAIRKRMHRLEALIAIQEANERQLISDWKRTSLTDASRRAEQGARLKTYLWQRDLLLAESVMAQMRGTFRLARGVVIVGAVGTLVGGVLYATAIPESDGNGQEGANASTGTTQGASFLPGTTVTVTVVRDSPTWEAVEPPTCRRPAAGLRGVLLDADGDQPSVNGPFTVVVSEPASCAGSLSVARDEGTYSVDE